jgi:hypothetical protein
LAIVFVLRNEKTDLKERRIRIQQARNPLARRQFAIAMLFVDLLGPAAGAKPLFEHVKICGQVAHIAGEIWHFGNC